MQFSKLWASISNKPELIVPADGTFLAFFNKPVFSWTSIPGAASYRFQITGSSSDFGSPLLSVDTLSTTYQPSNPLANGIYYWRVIPIDVGNHLGTPSNSFSFTSSYGTQRMDMIPSLISPQDGSITIVTPSFHWTSIMGAEHYHLEYTSDIACDFSLGTSIETQQTIYTPTETFTNNAVYCWHVRVESGPAIGDWSQTWHFQKIWNLKPVLLTPTNHYQSCQYPLYSWTPVPGASHYRIEISQNSAFNPIYEESITSNTTYAPQAEYDGTSQYWWRVTPMDSSGQSGTVSDISEYQSAYNSEAPSLIYPLYYYQPNNYPGYSMNPVENRAVAFPLFLWHRVMVPAPTGGVYAKAYRIQVNTTPDFTTPVWDYSTENTSASPTSSSIFSPIAGEDYYWRVCPLDAIGGNCMLNSKNGSVWWSQVWKARFDNNLELPPTGGAIPELLQPEPGQESVEATPFLEWYPMQNVTQYQVRVSRDPDFSTTEISETIDIPVYSLKFSLAQRSLDRTDYGTFFWQARGYAGNGWSDWSNSGYFEIASQSEWRYSRSLGSQNNRLLIGDDPVSDAPYIYDLTTLNASQSNDNWYISFNANISTTDMTYVVYLDLDNVMGSGAPSTPRGDFHVSTIPQHLPEYAIYINVISGIVNSQNTFIYAWDGNSWGLKESLNDIGGSLYFSSGYVELQIPNDAIGMNQDSGSTSVALFTVNISDGMVQDSVPSNPISGNTVLRHFSAVSDHMNLVYPPDTIAGNPTSLTSILPFYWDWPTGSNAATPFAGSILQVDLDQNYSPPHEATFQIDSSTTYFSENNVSLLNNIIGDNVYYWRVCPKYMSNGFPDALGAWSEGWSFHLSGFLPQNLHTSNISNTLTFNWDLAEGADSYRLQVASDPNFGYPAIDVITQNGSYAPPISLPQGLYYWRVRIIRYGNISNGWTQAVPLEYILPIPTGLTPDQDFLNYAPTFCWKPLPSAWKYNIQVSTDPLINQIIDSASTHNNCWTPTIGYADKPYYWHVALMDANNNLGSYSATATFTKQYPVTIIKNPSKEVVTGTPTFFWTPVDGAATYIIEISWNPTFSSLYDTVETINTQYTPITSYENNKYYYWRVAIRDLNGFKGPFIAASSPIRIEKIIFLPLINK